MSIKPIIENYLAILHSDDCDEAGRIQKLIISLDELALATHNAGYTFDERDHPEPPEDTFQELRARIATLFPSLGYYNVATEISGNIGQSSLSVGDAIDDIADIAGDLKEVMWRFENTSENDALFHFQLLFRNHWGMHLRSLQLYLYDTIK